MRYLKYFESFNDIIGNIVNKFSDPETFADAMLNGYVTKIPIKGLSVSMNFLKIAEKNLAEGKESVTPNDPVDVTINVDDKDPFLTDGYHRYLKLRGGTIQKALENSRKGVYGDILSKIKLERNYKSTNGFRFSEPLTKEELVELYKKYKKPFSE